MRDNSYINKAAAPGSAELHWLLVAASLRGHLLGLPLLQTTLLHRVLGALLTGGVAGHHVMAVLLLLGLAHGYFVLDLVYLVLSPALGLVDRPAQLLPRLLLPAVLHDGGPAHLHSLVISLRLILDVANFPVNGIQ